MSTNPKPPRLKSGLYGDEPATFTDVNGLFKFVTENHVRASRTSPPVVNDLKELTWVVDKTLLRLYVKIDGALRYVQLT